MEESTATQGAEKIERVGRNIISWAIYSVLTLLILGAAFWALFYSVDLANLSFVIPLRNSYQDVYRKISGMILGTQDYSAASTIYTIQPQGSNEPGLYTYTMIGTYEKLDAPNYLIYIKGFDSNIYTFYIENFIYEDASTWLKIALVPNLNTLASGMLPISGVKTSPTNPLLADYRQTLINEQGLASPLNVVGVRWNDKRTLSDILKDYSNNRSLPLNNDSPESFVLAEFK